MYDNIFLFIQVVKYGGFNSAARQLNTSQSRISRRIKELEIMLGAKILKRDTHFMEMTPFGELIYAEFANYEQLLQNDIEKIRHKDRELSGLLNIALHPAFTTHLINPKIVDFAVRYPKVQINIAYAVQQLEMVKSGYSIAVSDKMPKSQNSIIKRIATFHQRLYASPKYIKKYGLPTSPQEMEKHRIIGYLDSDSGEPVKTYTLKNINDDSQVLLQLEPQIYAESLFQTVELATSGEFIVSAWDYLPVVKEKLKHNNLVAILPDYYFHDLPCYLIYAQPLLSNLEKTFASFLEQSINAALTNSQEK
ncbi:MAG: LysR family transcriptional regulator [Neisseriales bacterium]|nr:MAG: LysR family transcriptional regulator [Neisseriales bacterium]